MKNIIKKIFLFILTISILVIAIILYANYIGTKGLKVKEYKMTNSKLPDNFHGLKIIHLSDLHYGYKVNSKDLKNITNKINELKPDLIVFTGDLFDKNIKLNEKELNEITNAFSNMKATIGKYAISGNEDFNNKKYETILTNSNFINLNDTFDYIYYLDQTPIFISGISSNLENKKNINSKTQISQDEIIKYETQNQNDLYSILIMHEPDFIDDISLENTDLILAGHSLGGKINIPIIRDFFLEEGALKYNNEYYRINNTDLYISTGIGTDEFTYRLFNKPSINFYRLTNH